jgi:hypothetical protein
MAGWKVVEMAVVMVERMGKRLVALWAGMRVVVKAEK